MIVPFVDREREQLHLVGQGTFEPVGELVGGRRPGQSSAELRDRVGGDGYAGEHHCGRAYGGRWASSSTAERRGSWDRFRTWLTGTLTSRGTSAM